MIMTMTISFLQRLLKPETKCQSIENLILMATIWKRPRLECCDHNQDKILTGEKTFSPVDLLLMERQAIEEVDGNVSSGGSSVSSD